MGIRDTLFGKRVARPVELPVILQPENPVNYDSVLDYLVGLAQKDYDKLIKVTGIYRDANKSAARVLGVKDQPTTTLVSEQQTEEEIDSDLDGLLETNPEDLLQAIVDSEPAEESKKSQSPSKDKKISVNGK